MQLETADQAIDIIEGDFYERYNFYMYSCVISPLAFLFKIFPKYLVWCKHNDFGNLLSKTTALSVVDPGFPVGGACTR